MLIEAAASPYLLWTERGQGARRQTALPALRRFPLCRTASRTVAASERFDFFEFSRATRSSYFSNIGKGAS